MIKFNYTSSSLFEMELLTIPAIFSFLHLSSLMNKQWFFFPVEDQMPVNSLLPPWWANLPIFHTVHNKSVSHLFVPLIIRLEVQQKSNSIYLQNLAYGHGPQSPLRYMYIIQVMLYLYFLIITISHAMKCPLSARHWADYWGCNAEQRSLLPGNLQSSGRKNHKQIIMSLQILSTMKEKKKV